MGEDIKANNMKILQEQGKETTEVYTFIIAQSQHDMGVPYGSNGRGEIEIVFIDSKFFDVRCCGWFIPDNRNGWRIKKAIAEMIDELEETYKAKEGIKK